MKKKIISILIFIVLFAGAIYIISNRQMANQIIIGTQDICDSIFNNSSSTENVENIVINELQPTHSTFYYNTLTDDQKIIYLSLANAIKDLNSKAKIKGYNYIDDNTTMKDVKIAVEKLFLDHPEVFYVNNDYTVSTIDLLNSKRIEVELSYLVKDKANLDDKIEKINNVLNPLIEEAKSMDKFNAELYLHDKICELAKYYKYEDINQVPTECHSAYGTFVLKQAVCDGLSKALQIALDKAGIENIIITGYLQNQAHAWNLVKLDEGWYHVDVTSDKSVKDSSNNEEIIHSYFNVTTEQIKITNSIDAEDVIPTSNLTTYNYYLKTDKYIKSTDNFSNKLKTILDQNQNSNLIEFTTDSNVGSVPEKMVYVLQDNKYTKYTNQTLNKFNYYKVLNAYILLINK